MDSGRTGLGVIGGVGPALAILVLLRELTPRLFLALSLQDIGQSWWTALLLVLGGVAVAVVMLVSGNYPLVSGVAGVLVLAVHLPLSISLTTPEWYPDWLSQIAITSAGAEPLLVGGTLVGAAGWSIGASLNTKRQKAIGASRT